MVQCGIRTTQPSTGIEEHKSNEPDPVPAGAHQSCTRHVAVDAVATIPDKDLPTMIGTDLPGLYPPIPSKRDHKYMFIVYDTDNDFIDVIPT